MYISQNTLYNDIHTYSIKLRIKVFNFSIVRFGSLNFSFRSFPGIWSKCPHELDKFTTLACGRNRGNNMLHTFNNEK